MSSAPVHPDTDHDGIDAQSTAPVPDESDVFYIGISAAKRRAGIDDPYEHLTGSCCLSRFYSAQQHAAQLLAYAVLYDRCPDGEIISSEIQGLHGSMVSELRWYCRPWNPVARQLTLLTNNRKVYRRKQDSPPGVRERVYPLPSAAEAARTCERVLGRCSLFVPEAEREFLWPGPPTVEHCPRVPHPCPLWRPWHGR